MIKRIQWSLLLLCAVIAQAYSQEMPVIKAGEKQILIKKLNVHVDIIGDIAITMYDMHFYNPYDRVLEGELSFPLEENQSVIRFALDLDGTLRDAVIVEKEKARVAYENTIRRRIDPALLEQTKGNNYKARVYPIPSKGYKRVLIGYQQKLNADHSAIHYKLPLDFKHKLESFSLVVNALDQKKEPQQSGLSNVRFRQEKGNYTLTFKGRNMEFNKNLDVYLPAEKKRQKLIVDDQYFYVSKELKPYESKANMPRMITVFWDTSLSQINKDTVKEFAFLEGYFKLNRSVDVNLINFNIAEKKQYKFSVKNGDWGLLKQKLKQTVYDGATSFEFLKDYTDNSEAYFLFSNGLNTLNTLFYTKGDKKIMTVNSVKSSNHVYLRNLAENSGGRYFNLNSITPKDALLLLQKEDIMILGTNVDGKGVEYYPVKRSKLGRSFSLLGKKTVKNELIKIYLGNDTDTIETITFNPDSENPKSQYIRKIWGQKKMNHLQKEEKKNRDDIVELSKKYQIISPFTSMLVLDRIEDYVRYKIEPPAAMKEEYDRLLAVVQDDTKRRMMELQNDLFNQYNKFYKWYDKKYKKIKKNKIAKRENTRVNAANVFVNTNGVNGNIFGNVSDENGGLPGVSVIVQGTTNGVQTDFDGNFRINAQEGNVLVFSYLGYKTVSTRISGGTAINVLMEEGGEVLDEVVIVGYGSVTKKAYAGTASVVKAENLNAKSSSNVAQALTGEVAGVTVINTSGQPGTIPTVRIRGYGSPLGNRDPLYVVDGIPFSGSFDLNSINPADIESTTVLKDAAATAIYGSRGANGVILIRTKKGEFSTGVSDNQSEKLETVAIKNKEKKKKYVQSLEKITEVDIAYKNYLVLRKLHFYDVAFYIDVADNFNARGEKKRAMNILSNIIELNIGNAEIYKTLAYKFESFGAIDKAILCYQEILELRPEDIQSYRDLALVYELKGDYQKSFDLLYRIVGGELLEKDMNRRFEGIEPIALMEMNRLLNKYSGKINLDHIDKRVLNKLDVDIRVVIDWNHDNTDIDLWVIDPNGQKCYYSNKKTSIGGLISNDMTDGFGPEQFVLKEAIKGKYKIKVDFYGNSRQKISGPTFIKLTTFVNYGRKNESKLVKFISLTGSRKTADLGYINF